MDTAKAIEYLQNVHEEEQRTGKLIRRKQFSSMLPEDMPWGEKRFLIKSWQGEYFKRLSHVGFFRRLSDG